MNKHNERIISIRTQLVQLYEGGNWLAESFAKKLNDLTEPEAFNEPMPGVHSVAEIVWHCAYWRRVNLERMAGNPGYRDQTIDEQNFLPLEKLKSMGWKKLLSYLEATQTDLITLLDGKTDSFLDTEYSPGQSFGFLLLGTIEHDAYHLGQIGLVIKINNTIQSS